MKKPFEYAWNCTATRAVRQSGISSPPHILARQRGAILGKRSACIAKKHEV